MYEYGASGLIFREYDGASKLMQREDGFEIQVHPEALP